MNQRELIKELAKSIALHVSEQEFISCCLCSLRTDEERTSMIEYLKGNESLSKTDIEILRVTREKGACSMKEQEYWFKKRMEDIPKPIVVGEGKLTEEELSKGREDLKRLIKESVGKKVD